MTTNEFKIKLELLVREAIQQDVEKDSIFRIFDRIIRDLEDGEYD